MVRLPARAVVSSNGSGPARPGTPLRARLPGPSARGQRAGTSTGAPRRAKSPRPVIPTARRNGPKPAKPSNRPPVRPAPQQPSNNCRRQQKGRPLGRARPGRPTTVRPSPGSPAGASEPLGVADQHRNRTNHSGHREASQCCRKTAPQTSPATACGSPVHPVRAWADRRSRASWARAGSDPHSSLRWRRLSAHLPSPLDGDTGSAVKPKMVDCHGMGSMGVGPVQDGRRWAWRSPKVTRQLIQESAIAPGLAFAAAYTGLVADGAHPVRRRLLNTIFGAHHNTRASVSEPVPSAVAGSDQAIHKPRPFPAQLIAKTNQTPTKRTAPDAQPRIQSQRNANGSNGPETTGQDSPRGNFRLLYRRSPTQCFRPGKVR